MKRLKLIILALAACFSVGAFADACSDAGAPSDCKVSTSSVTFGTGVENHNFNCPSSLPYAWGGDLSSTRNIWVSGVTWADDGHHGIKVIMWFVGSGKTTVTVDLACSGTQDKSGAVNVKIS